MTFGRRRPSSHSTLQTIEDSEHLRIDVAPTPSVAQPLSARPAADQRRRKPRLDVFWLSGIGVPKRQAFHTLTTSVSAPCGSAQSGFFRSTVRLSEYANLASTKSR